MSRLLALPGEIRNQIYHDVFEDGKVKNLQLLQTCRQINYESGTIGFASTVFTIKLNSTLIEERVQNLSYDRKSCIKTVRRRMFSSATFKSLRSIYKASILPTSVILLPRAHKRTWSHATGLRSFSLCPTPLSNVMSDVVMGNANLANLTFSKNIGRELHVYRILGLGVDSVAKSNMTNAKFQLQQYQVKLDRWVTGVGSAGSARVEEIERCRMGLKEVRITIKMRNSAVQRILSVRWVMILGDGGNK